jgi:hypothetical protein
MSAPAIAGLPSVETAIRRAAGATGVDFQFLLSTAVRESGLNPQAKARTSSAAGLFQFVDQTWLSALKRFGTKHGLGLAAGEIETGADGRLHVPNPAARRTVMDLRLDPQTAALMAGELTADHAAYLRGRTGREPTAGELYAAHFLGPAGSARLIETASTSPAASAASLFPEAAEANRGVFFHAGRSLSVSEVLANLSRVGGAASTIAPSGAADTFDPREAAIAQRLDRLRHEEQVLSLFNGEGGLGGGLGGGSLVDAQLLGAFGPGEKS